ncbi:MAG: esterase-like activity of phytase family protein [Pseudomonadota bacterium]
MADEIAVRASPVSVEPTRLRGAEPAGAWRLSSDHPGFGGFSGLEIARGRMLAVSDRGSVLRAILSVSESSLIFSEAQLTPLGDRFGTMQGKDHGDAEGLAALDAGMAVSFEREHRVGLLAGDRVEPLFEPPDFDSLAYNGGLEGLAALPDGRLLALAETPEGDAAPYFILGEKLESGKLPLRSRHRVTGADLGPKGRLYLVLRDYSRLTGVSIRVMRYALDLGHPVPSSGTELAAWETASGIDNMEGIAVEETEQGTWLWLISDDNFNLLQRNLLIRLRLED